MLLLEKDELFALGEVCLKHNVLVVSDEIYEKLVYGKNEHVLLRNYRQNLKK